MELTCLGDIFQCVFKNGFVNGLPNFAVSAWNIAQNGKANSDYLEHLFGIGFFLARREDRRFNRTEKLVALLQGEHDILTSGIGNVEEHALGRQIDHAAVFSSTVKS